MTRLTDVLDLERIDLDIFRGPAYEGSFARAFGGQVAGQALSAAAATTSGDRTVHSLHGYFLRPGKPGEPIVYLVERSRDGGSFTTRRVVAVQNGESIFSMSASFHRRENSYVEHQEPAPAAPDPLTLPLTPVPHRRALIDEFSDFDFAFVPVEDVAPNGGRISQQQVWFKHREPLPADPLYHICTLAYMSDISLLGSSLVMHTPQLQERPGVFASLDHAMWFLRPFRADDWLLYDQNSPSAADARALTEGRIFDRAGNLVAMVMQEGLVREPRP